MTSYRQLYNLAFGNAPNSSTTSNGSANNVRPSIPPRRFAVSPSPPAGTKRPIAIPPPPNKRSVPVTSSLPPCRPVVQQAGLPVTGNQTNRPPSSAPQSSSPSLGSPCSSRGSSVDISNGRVPLTGMYAQVNRQHFPRKISRDSSTGSEGSTTGRAGGSRMSGISGSLRRIAGRKSRNAVPAWVQKYTNPNIIVPTGRRSAAGNFRPRSASLSDERSTWEHLSVTLRRVSGYGFGIAVSGGRDNPHFKNGDPSIVVSDVLRGGPAWGQLQINDRIVSSNGVNLENADYQSAVQIMKEADTLNMIVKRRVPLPSVEFEQRTLKFTLTKSKRKDSFGIVLGCKYYIKHINNPKLAEKEPGLREGDTVAAINGQSCEAMSFTEAQKMLEKCRERLSLVVQRDVPRGSPWRWGSQTTLYERLGSVVDTPRDSPRASPSVAPRYTIQQQQQEVVDGRMSLPRRQVNRMAASDYMQPGPSGLQQATHSATYMNQPMAGSHSGRSSAYGHLGAQSPGPIGPGTHRSRTPSHRRSDGFGNAGDTSADEYSSTYGVPKMMAPGFHPGVMPHQAPHPQAASPNDLLQSYQNMPGGPGTVSPTKQFVPVPSAFPVSPQATTPIPDARQVTFRKESGSVGVRVIGGNEVGIFVSAVQPSSPAANKGVKPGDKILQVNGQDMRNVTREEAVLFLLSLQDEVDLLLQYRKDEYNRVRTQNLGDNFCIRAHFDYEKPDNTNQMMFHRGDIFQVNDTLFGGAVGAWQAIKLTAPSSSNAPAGTPEHTQSKGIIPNQKRAEQICEHQRTARSESADIGKDSTLGRTSTFFRKKMGFGGGGPASRRSKSLTKGHWDEVVFGQSEVKFPAYERVKLKHPGFLRPVVLFGPLADLARELLLKDFPLRFASPETETSATTTDGKTPESPSSPTKMDNKKTPADNNKDASGIVKLSSIKEIMNKNKHCVMDVTPASVERLQQAQYCPIVIYLGVENRARLRTLRDVKSMPKIAAVSTKKLMEQGAKIQKHYSHLFTATLDATKEDHWFEALRELVSHLQERRVWMADRLPDNATEDDYLFPMAASRTYITDSSDVESMKGDYSTSDLAASPRHEDPHRRFTQQPIPNYVNGRLIGAPQRHDNEAMRSIPSIDADSDTATTTTTAIGTGTNTATTTCSAAATATNTVNTVLGSSSPTVSDIPPKLPNHGGPLRNGGVDMGQHGFYDVKQILAEHQLDDLDEAASALSQRLVQRTPSPQLRGQPIGRVRQSPMMMVGQQSRSPQAPRPYLTNGMRQYSDYDNPSQFGPVPFSAGYQQPTSIVNSSEPSAFSRSGSVPTRNGPINARQQVPPPAPPSRPLMQPPQPMNDAIASTSTAINPLLATNSSNVMTVSTITTTSTSSGAQDTTQSRTEQNSTPDQLNDNVLRLSSAESTPSPRGAMATTGSEQQQEPSRTDKQQTPVGNKPAIPVKPKLNGSSPPRGGSSGSGSDSTMVNGTSELNTSTGTGSRTLHQSVLESNVVAHVSGVFDGEGGRLVSEDTGVSIVIPPGALPTDKAQEIYFKVCRGDTETGMAPPLDTERGETLLSPLVMCGPQGLEFARPVELRLPHSASTVNSDQWSFALKSATGAQADWKQVSLSDSNSSSQLNENYVSVMIDHF